MTEGDAHTIEQITKQLNKLVHVLKVVELPADSSTQRGHILIKVKADAVARLQIVQAADLFRASVIDVSPESVVIEATGSEEKLNALLDVLEPYGVREIVRAGHHRPGTWPPRYERAHLIPTRVSYQPRISGG